MKPKIKMFIKKLIQKYGIEVKRKARVEHLENGEVYYTYTAKEPVKGQFTQITPVDNLLNRYGIDIAADYIGTFLPSVEIEEGDLLYINDGWYEVQNKIVRRSGTIDHYIEVLLRRKND